MDKLEDDKVFRKRIVKVYFEDGDNLTTSINGTVEEVKRYYIGNTFNRGIAIDKMVKAVRVEFLG